MLKFVFGFRSSKVQVLVPLFEVLISFIFSVVMEAFELEVQVRVYF